jgi:hypothetical protein
MADKRISQLNSHTTPSGSDLLVIVNNNETKKITYADLKDSIVINSDNALLNAFSASYLNDSASFHTRITAATNEQSLTHLVTTSSFNILSASIDSRVDSLENWSSSLDSTFATDLQVSIVSSSVAATIGIISQNTGLVTTSSFNSYTASQSTGSLVSRLNDLESHTGSYLTSLNGTISGSSQLTGSFDVRYTLSGSVTQTTWDNISGKPSGIISQSTDISSLNAFTASYFTNSSSFDSRLINLNSYTSSNELWKDTITNDISAINGVISSLNNTYATDVEVAAGYEAKGSGIISGSSQLTSSYDTRYTLSGSVQPLPNGVISGSSQLTASYDTRYTLSGSVVSGTTPAGTISGSSQISAFGFVSGSYTTTSSFNSFTASAQAVTTGSNSFNGTQTITGSLIITTGSFIGSQILANTSSLYLTSGSNLYVQNNGLVEITGSVRISGSNLTYDGASLNAPYLESTNSSGDEGGEIQLAIPQTNTTLTNKVIIDVYQNRLRLWEGGTNSKGVYIDLSKSPDGNAGELIWKASGLVNAGTFVSLDNLKCTVTTSGNRGLSIGAVSTNFTANISAYYAMSGGMAGSATNNISYTTTASTSAFSWHFTSEGDGSYYTIVDKTNNRMYRVTLMIGSGYNNNFISIERLY